MKCSGLSNGPIGRLLQTFKKYTFSKSPKRPREEMWENITTIVLDFLLVNYND
jgi:hypothetical protein